NLLVISLLLRIKVCLTLGCAWRDGWDTRRERRLGRRHGLGWRGGNRRRGGRCWRNQGRWRDRWGNGRRRRGRYGLVAEKLLDTLLNIGVVSLDVVGIRILFDQQVVRHLVQYLLAHQRRLRKLL